METPTIHQKIPDNFYVNIRCLVFLPPKAILLNTKEYNQHKRLLFSKKEHLIWRGYYNHLANKDRVKMISERPNTG